MRMARKLRTSLLLGRPPRLEPRLFCHSDLNLKHRFFFPDRMVFKSKAILSGKNAIQRFRDRWKFRSFEVKALSRPVKLAVIGSRKTAAYHLEALRIIK